MADLERASQLGQRGLYQWGEGHLREAADCFREAISLMERSHYMLSTYHGSLGGVLSALGEDEDALTEFVEALAVDIEQYGDDASAAVAVSRYFLAEHLLKLHREEEALSCLAPSLPGVEGVDVPIPRSGHEVPGQLPSLVSLHNCLKIRGYEFKAEANAGCGLQFNVASTYDELRLSRWDLACS